jgi:type I restriction enzyme S subunit
LPGGIKSELKPKRFLSVPVPLPSLSGQQRIVARIEALARRVEEARGLRRAAVEEAEAIKRRAIDFFISPRLCRQPLTKFLAEPLLNGLSIPAAKMGIGNLFAKVGIVNTGVLDPHQTKYVDVQLPPDSPYWMRRGDLFVSRGNTPNLVGRAAVYEGNPPDCAMPDLLIRIRVNLELADPKFIARYFHSSEARQYVESHVTGTSPTMKKISQPKLEAMPIPVLPLTEQHRIVAYLDGLQAKVDELRRLQAETQKELNALMPSILAKAFAGEL